MKVIYFIPLTVYLTAMIIAAFLMMPREQSMIFQYGSYLFFISMTCCFGIYMTLRNRDAVIKSGKRSPYLSPIIFFLIPTILMTVVTVPRHPAIIIGFTANLLLGVAVYAAGIIVLLTDLKKKHLGKINEHQLQMTFSGNRPRLLLINPVTQNRSGLSMNESSKFPPLSLGIIAALSRNDFDIKLIDENFDAFTYEEADLVAITAFTSSANRAYEIASQYTKPGTPVIMGGIHASMLPDEALLYVTSVVTGEAEDIWPAVIEDFFKGQVQQLYRGSHADLQGAVIPDRSIFNPGYQFASIQTSRGCPMDCSFCSVSTFNGKKYRQRPVEEVLDELESIPQRYIFIIDDNILGYGRHAEERAIRLFRGMVDRKLDKVWHCQASLNFGSNHKVLKWAARSGCKLVFIGLESADPCELESMNKKLNLHLEYRKAFKNIHRHGIAITGAFIYGSDAETRESMVRKTDYILKNDIDVIDTTILTPLPGTRLFNDLLQSNRLNYTAFPKDWDRYDMTEVTYQLKNISETEFLDTLERCIKKFNSLLTLYKKFFMTLTKTRRLETAIWAYNSNKVFRNVPQGRAQARFM